MKKLLLALILLFGVKTGFAAEVMIAEANGASIRLLKTECANEKITEFVTGPAASLLGLNGSWFAGNVVWEGKLLALCWMALDINSIFVVDETGDGGSVPIKIFRPAEGI